jgi:osmotically-inducible protein OsmY
MRMLAMAVIGLCGALSFGCAEAKKLEGEAATAAKEVEKNPEAKKLEQKVEDKVENKGDSKASPAPAGGDAALEKSVTAVVPKTVKVAAKGGVVTLTGTASASDKAAAEKSAKGVSGVSSVTNNITAK